jgi:hypothetical protein
MWSRIKIAVMIIKVICCYVTYELLKITSWRRRKLTVVHFYCILLRIYSIMFLACFPYFKKIKVGLWDYRAVCVCVCVSLSVYPPPSTFERRYQSLWNLVCTLWHLSPSHQHTSQIPPISLCLYVIPFPLLGSSLVKTLLRQRIHMQQ